MEMRHIDTEKEKPPIALDGLFIWKSNYACIPMKFLKKRKGPSDDTEEEEPGDAGVSESNIRKRLCNF